MSDSEESSSDNDAFIEKIVTRGNKKDERQIETVTTSDSSDDDVFVEKVVTRGNKKDEQQIEKVTTNDSSDHDSEDGGRCGEESDISSASHSRKHIYYSLEEDLEIIKYLLEGYNYLQTKGRKVFKDMANKKICPGRSFESLRDRFRRGIVSNLHSKKYNLDEEAINKLKQIDVDFYLEDDGEKIALHPRRLINYSKEEDMKIIKYMCKNDNYQRAKSSNIWKLAVEKEVVPNRTASGMKHRFLLIIAPRINDYPIPESWKTKISSIRDPSLQDWKTIAKFTNEDDIRLINFLLKGKKYIWLNTINIYKVAEDDGVCPGKSCTQMKRRAILIADKIKNNNNPWNLSEEKREKLIYVFTTAHKKELQEERKNFDQTIFEKEHKCIRFSEVHEKKSSSISSEDRDSSNEEKSASSGESENDELKEKNLLLRKSSACLPLRETDSKQRITKGLKENQQKTLDNLKENEKSNCSYLKLTSTPEKAKRRIKRKRDDSEDLEDKPTTNNNAVQKKTQNVEKRIVSSTPKKSSRSSSKDRAVKKVKGKKNKVNLNSSVNNVSIKAIIRKLKKFREKA